MIFGAFDSSKAWLISTSNSSQVPSFAAKGLHFTLGGGTKFLNDLVSRNKLATYGSCYAKSYPIDYP
jgi:hypothetical protein